MINLGLAIKRERMRQGISQNTLAKRIGTPATYLSVIEKGRKEISPGMVRRLAKELRIVPEVLIWDAVDVDHQMPPKDRKIVLLAKTLVQHYLSKR